MTASRRRRWCRRWTCGRRAGRDIIAGTVTRGVEARSRHAGVIGPASDSRALEPAQPIVGIGGRFLCEGADRQNGNGGGGSRQPRPDATHEILPADIADNTLQHRLARGI